MASASPSNPVAGFFEQLSSVQPVPDGGLLGLTLLAAFALTAPPAWHWTRNFITVAHEGGHALVGVLMGRRLSGIKLHSDTSGVTVSRGKPHGLGMILTVLAGYTAPGLMGLGLGYLLAQGRISAALLLVTILLALMFLMLRNFWGILVVGPTVFALHWISTHLAPELQGLVLALMVWFLVVGSFRPIWELQMHRARGEAPDSDADQLQRLTLVVPGIVWVGVFGLIACATAYGTIQLLLL